MNMAQDPIIREIELQLDLIKHSANEAIRRINFKGDNLSENDKSSIKKHFELILFQLPYLFRFGYSRQVCKRWKDCVNTLQS